MKRTSLEHSTTRPPKGMGRMPMLLALLFAASLSASASPPNIVLIVADDLGYGDLGCYGQKLLATPNIDRLAAEGLRFTQAYAGGPVCASSRSVLLTGLHNGRTAARDNVPHYPTYLEEEDTTLAEVLQAAGYRTGGVGKWSLGDARTPGAALEQGFDHWFGYLNQDHAHYYWTEYLDDDAGQRELPGNPVTREHYSHDLFTEWALEFIRESSADREAPFFLFAAYTLPHFSAKDEDRDGLAVPSTDPYTGRDWPEKAKKYGAMVDRLDRDVGRITMLIDELGLAENTLVLFTSDNGGHSTVWEGIATSGPLRGFKRDLYEGGIRVPFLARWTGTVPAGEVSDEVIAFEDLFSTFARLAGAELPEGLDGLDIGDALRGGKLATPRKFLYWDYGHCRPHYDQAVRLGDWKGIRLGRQGGRLQLYDLASDIGETHDLAEDYPGVVERIAAIMDTAATPSPRYPVGEIYRGGSIWRVDNHHPSQRKLPPRVQPGDPGIVSSGFVCAPGALPTATCHSATLVELPDDTLAAAWFGGTSEPDIDNSIWFSRQEGGVWQPPVEIVNGSEGEDRIHRTGNPVLFQAREEGAPLLLFYKVVPPEPNRAAAWWGMMTRSEDGGRTWAAPWKLGTDERLGSRPHLIGPVKNAPMQLPDGAILCPSSTEHEGWRVHFEITRDLGKTWEVIGPVDDGHGFNAIQPSLLDHGDGRLQVLCRSREGVVVQSWSHDGGNTWEPITATHLPNPDSGIDALTLAGGRHLLVYNHTLRSGPFPAKRSELNVALSDDGRKWEPVLTLERERGEYSYPVAIQSRDGLVHIAYTWKRKGIRHMVLDPASLAKGKTDQTE